MLLEFPFVDFEVRMFVFHPTIMYTRKWHGGRVSRWVAKFSWITNEQNIYHFICWCVDIVRFRLFLLSSVDFLMWRDNVMILYVTHKMFIYETQQSRANHRTHITYPPHTKHYTSHHDSNRELEHYSYHGGMMFFFCVDIESKTKIEDKRKSCYYGKCTTEEYDEGKRAFIRCFLFSASTDLTRIHYPKSSTAI